MTGQSDAQSGNGESLRQHDLFYDALGQIYKRLSQDLKRKRFDVVLRTLRMDDYFATAYRSHPRLRAAVYDYAIFAYPWQGRTLFQEWLETPHDRPRDETNPILGKLVAAIADSRYSAFDIETVEHGVGVGVRDVLNGDRHFVADRLMSGNWTPGSQFANRLVVLSEIALFTSEPLEAIISPGKTFHGGVLSAIDQAKLQAAVIEAFAEAVTS
jgi:hypothetical protein